MSEGKVFISEAKRMDEDEPEEGEIQDDGSLEDVSSDEDVPSTCSKKTHDSSYGNTYPISHIAKTEYVAYSPHPYNSRVSKASKRERKRFPSITEGSQSRLNVIKYREETNETSNDVYHVTVNTVVVDDRRRDDNFDEMLSEYKSIRPKQSVKDEDIVQEKENRHDCQKETKVRKKCRRKRRHTLLNNPEPRRSLSSDSKTGSEVGIKKVVPGEEGKKKSDSFTKLGTKSKSSHSKKRSVSPKREKRRCQKKKDYRKYLSRKLSVAVQQNDCAVDGAHGNSLLKRLQTMMTVNVSARKENTIVESIKEKDEDGVQSQQQEHGLKKKLCNILPALVAVKSGNENCEGISEKAEILKEANQNHVSVQSSQEIEILPDIKKPEPVVITIEDSDSDPQVSVEVLECNSAEKINKEDEIKTVEGKASAKGMDDDEDDEDLVQLRLLALQSNRRKETSKPRVEDDEVMQLRLAALKSAILRKCEVRKQRGVTLKSKKINTLNSPVSSDLENGSMKDDSGQETPKQIPSMEALQSEPDETTTLVDMDLSHTDDESSAQNEIITDPVSADIPLPEDSESTFLQLMHEDNNTQNVCCSNEPLLKVNEDQVVDLKQNQKAGDVVSTWNPAATIYRSPEAAKFDIESCQLSGVYSNNVQIPSMNSVGYSSSQLSFSSSSFPQQQLYNELYQSSNNPDLPSADLDGVPIESLSCPFNLPVSTVVSGSFGSSNLNSPPLKCDALLASRVEPQVISTNSFSSKIEFPPLKTNSTMSKMGIHVPRSSSVAATEDPQFSSTNSLTLRTGTEAQRTDSVTYTQFHSMDSTTVSCQNWDRNRKIHLDSRNHASNKKSLSAGHTKPTGMAESDSSLVFPVPTELFSSLNTQIQELKRMKAEVLLQSQYVAVSARETIENRADCNVEENASELENIDLSNMIVLDEVGRCSSPEAKVEEIFNELVPSKSEDISRQCDQSSGNLDEDEEVLRAKLLTALARKPSTSTAVLKSIPKSIKDNAISSPSEVSNQEIKTSVPILSVSPHFISPGSITSPKAVQHTSLIRRKEKTPSKLPCSLHELKGCTKITQRLPSKKFVHSHGNLPSYSKGNIIRAKCWKRPVKKGFSGTNIKQMLTEVNRNPGRMKQLRECTAALSNDAQNMGIELKTSIARCKPIGKSVSRVVFHPRVPKPATIQVTVPTKSVDDEQCRRKIAESVTNSSVPIQPPQRFVIRLGEDSDSPDEEDKIQQMAQAPKRRCVMKNNSSSPLLTVSTSATHVSPRDPHVNCDSTIGPSLLSQLDHPLSDKQNTVSVVTQLASNSRISADFEKSVDIFLKQARKSQEARANSAIQNTLTPHKSSGGKINPEVSSVTPLAVRHLPSSQQEEYHRLKQQIAELEEQRKRCQQQQQHQQQPPHFSNSMTCKKSASFPSSPSRTTGVSGSVKSPLKVVLRNTTAEKKKVSQSSLTSVNLVSDSGRIFRTLYSTHIQGNTATKKAVQNFAAAHAQESGEMKTSDKPGLSTVASNDMQIAVNDVVSADTLLQKLTESVKSTVCAAASLAQMSREQQRGTAGKAKKLDNVMRKEEEPAMESKEHISIKDGFHEVPACKSDGLSNIEIACDESVEEKEAKLATIEHQLLSKRYEVLDDLTNMTALLQQVELERATEDKYLTELHHIRAELHRAEERLAQQKELLSNMCNDIAESRRRVAQGRAECIGLSKTCLSLGISVKGHHYKVPAGGAEHMNLKLQQVAAQTRRMSRKKEYLEDIDENQTGSDISAFINLEVPVQEKTDIRTACRAVESTKDNNLVSNKVCASPVMDVNEESGSQEKEIIPIQATENCNMMVSKTDNPQPKCVSSTETLDFKLSEQPSISSVPLALQGESEIETRTASELDRFVLVPNRGPENYKSDGAVTDETQNGVPIVIDSKQISTGVSEDLHAEAFEMMVLGMGSSSEDTVLQHITEYRSPLEHFHSKRGNSESGDDWCGPLDPLAILCPYELMGSCQDEECSYQHYTKNSTT